VKKFDWRQYEPSDLRKRNWPKSQISNLLDRYRENLGDLRPWQRLVRQLAEGPSYDSSSPEAKSLWAETQCLEEFDRFLEDISGAIVRPSKACVFISHQRRDTTKALRIADFANHLELDYWLDVHDPTLAFANQRLPASDPRRSILIAATIEIALLSSTHLIALHTRNSKRSKWVPYELGRAKARKIKSVQAAGWFQHPQTVPTFGDYVQLAVRVHDDRETADWLQEAAGGSG